jgi:hypothetical protein
MSRGPMLARVQALPPRFPLRRGPTAAAWLVAQDASQRAEPDTKPIKPCSLDIYCGKDAPPATTLTGDVPSQHLMCPVPSAGRRCQGHPAGGAPAGSVSKQCARAEWRTVLTIPSTRSFPCTPKIRRSRVTGLKKIAPAANIYSTKRYILYVSGPACRGSVPLCMPPFNYKRGGMRRYKDPSSDSQYITQWSRVLRPGGPNHSKPSCALACSSTNLVTSKTLRPLLILGIRAGAIRHQAEEIYPPTNTFLELVIKKRLKYSERWPVHRSTSIRTLVVFLLLLQHYINRHVGEKLPQHSLPLHCCAVKNFNRS